MTTNILSRRLPLLDAKVGDHVKHEGAVVSITNIERSPDGHHWRVWLDGKLTIVPPGCVFTRPVS